MLNAESIDFIVALVIGWIERQIFEKEGEPSDNSGNLLPPLSYSLLQPHREHAGRLIWDNPEFLYAFDTLNITSWFPSKPQDDPLKLKVV